MYLVLLIQYLTYFHSLTHNFPPTLTGPTLLTIKFWPAYISYDLQLSNQIFYLYFLILVQPEALKWNTHLALLFCFLWCSALSIWLSALKINLQSALANFLDNMNATLTLLLLNINLWITDLYPLLPWMYRVMKGEYSVNLKYHPYKKQQY